MGENGKLETQIWTPVGRDQVYESFWQSEKFKKFHPNQAEGEITFSMWKRTRAPLLSKIPADTQWFEVSFLNGHNLDELLVMGRTTWDEKGVKNDKNEVKKVALRRPTELATYPEVWPRIILWGHTKTGPFTIIEGNHRLVAYAGQSNPPAFSVVPIIGVSQSPCCWHLPDPAGLFF